MSKKYFFWFVCLGIFTYLILRSIFLSITFDEQVSYARVILGNSDEVHANNHFLNTFFMELSVRWFGVADWSLRIFNVLSFIPYALGVFFILKRRESWIEWVLGMSCLLAIPYVLEFFSLARGYSYSMGFMMLALAVFLTKGVSTKSRKSYLKYAFISFIFSGLALLADLNIINVVIAFAFVVALFLIQFEKATYSKVEWMWVALGICTVLAQLIYGVQQLLLLMDKEKLGFGAKNEWEAFFTITDAFWFVPTPEATLWFVVILVGFTVLRSSYIIIKQKKLFSGLSAALIILLLVIVGYELEHYLFGANLPERRTGIHIIYLFSLVLFYFLGELREVLNNNLRWKLISGFVIVLFMTNMAFGMNLSYTSDWKFNADARAAARMMGEEAKDWDRPATFATHWLNYGVMNFYVATEHMNIERCDMNGIQLNTDFVYRLDYDCWFGIWDEPVAAKYRWVKTWETSQTTLLGPTRAN